jgi:hypothetical protein
MSDMRSHTHKAVRLPCNGCTVCCEHDIVPLHQEHGDDPLAYHTMIINGTICLARRRDGSCIYLSRGVGCLIHDRRPSICRSLDCRVFASPEYDGLLLMWSNGADLKKAGRRMVEATKPRSKKRKVRLRKLKGVGCRG